ncbi:MAG TPA: STAS domain-containing protein [Vicinamibacterales bacterium]|nr:STAS domain-containing protein [Vicinamibacterales bacterium]
MQIDERAVGDVIVLDLRGKFTAGDGDAIIKDTIQRLASRGVCNIILNFADVSYMDSVGLSTIIRARLTLCQHEGELKLLHLPRRVADLLALTRLTVVFETFDDESAAVRSFKRSVT